MRVMSKKEQKSLTAVVWQHCPSKYNGTALVVLVRLAGLSERDGHAWPGIETLAMMCGVKPRNLRYVVKTLSKDGVLAVRHRKGKSNHFHLNVEEIEKLPLVFPERESKPTAETPATRPSAKAVELAERIHKALPSYIEDANVPEDWKVRWPELLQPLLDDGHSFDHLRAVAKTALTSDPWRKDMKTDPAGTLARNFTVFHRLWQAGQTKAA